MNKISQKSFSALWDFQSEIQSGKISIIEGNKLCLLARNKESQKLKALGFKVKCFTLQKSLRPYWSFGISCNLICKTYLLNFWK